MDSTPKPAHGFIKVRFQPTGQAVFVPSGETVLAAAGEAGLELHTPCGGRGTCGSCRVVFASTPPDPTPDELTLLSKAELASGLRLACRAPLLKDSTIDVPPSTLRKDSKFLLHGIMRNVELAPAVSKVALALPPPSLEDQRSDADRLVGALSAAGVAAEADPGALLTLPSSLREGAFTVTAVVHGGRVTAVEPGDTSDELYAVAFDIGTTTVVGMLLNLRTGAECAVAARTNPQVSYGDDVVSRIGFAALDGGLTKLQSAIVSCINDIIAELSAAASVPPERIYQAVFCGNTSMNHFLLGIDPAYVAQAPYVAAVRAAVEVPAGALGIRVARAGRALTLPNVAGFVGSDTVAMMLAADYAHSDKLRLAIDIGTNGEIVLGNRKRLLCASTAAGPAFEGARIRHGMRAASGAIESVSIADGRLKIETINGGAPVGICGTGLIDAVAALLDAGLVDSTGRLLTGEDAAGTPELKKRISENDFGPHFVLATVEEGAARTVFLTQRDIRELQLAKAAIRAGITILLKEFGVGWQDLDEVLLAGAFGNYIKKESALRVGLLPPLPPDKITQIGNAAGTGAKIVALDSRLLAEADALSLAARYVELAGRADFQHIFAESMLFE